MHRVRGCDDGFLFIESDSQVFTYAYLAELVPVVDTGADAGGAGPLTLADLRVHVADRLDILPSFRWRLAEVPGKLHHPVMINDPDFDLDHHLRHVVLPAPGRRADLDRHLSEVVKTTLDRRHPLWQLVLVDGLDPSEDRDTDTPAPAFRQALIIRFQHVIADGTASRTTVMRLLSDLGSTPLDPALDAPAGTGPGPWRPEHPTRARLLRDALRDQARAARRMPALIRTTSVHARALRDHRREASVEVPKPIADTPECSLNQAFSMERSYLRTALDLESVKRVKDAAGVSVNDVVLAVVAGALRAYLTDRHDLPDRPLTVNVPVSTNPPGFENRQFGNYFANYLTTLATDIANPWERLATISTVAREGRAQLEIQGPDLVVEWLEYALPLLAEPVSRWWARFKWERPDRAEFSTIVSNVRGPDDELRFATTRVDRLHLQGPVADGNGLNITIVSYAGALNVVVSTNPDAVDDPHELIHRFDEALDELLACAEQPGVGADGDRVATGAGAT